MQRKDLIYPELSYKINGILFKVFKEMGPGYQEKYYQRAVSEELKSNKFNFKEQLKSDLIYQNKRIGNYYLDFLIEDKIILELKKGDYFKKSNIDQVYAYLKANKLKLGLLANFTSQGVKVKRILNIQ